MNALFTQPQIAEPILRQQITAPSMPRPLKKVTETQTRILSLNLPYLATDFSQRARLGASWRIAAKTDELWPMVHAHRSRNAMRIAHLDERATSLGLRVGQGLADAKAIYPELDIVPADETALNRALEGIADWCDRFTPLVALDAPDGLFLDVTGCAHLFGGERQLLREILAALYHQGFMARAAVAETAGAAWAAARFGSHQGVHIEKGAEVDLLRPFRLAALRLESDIIAALEKVGLKTIGQLMDTPRAPLMRRFGRAPLMRLDQMFGHIDEVLSPRLPAPDFSSEQRMAEPIGLVEDIEQTIYRLARSLKQTLEEKAIGARVIELTLFRVDGVVSRLCVGASRPVRDPELIVKLFRERLTGIGDDFDAGYGFDLIRLNIVSHGPIAAKQSDLSVAHAGDDNDLASLLDRIAARLGEAHIEGQNIDGAHPVKRVCFNQTHTPEKVDHWIAADHVYKSDDISGFHQPVAARPVRLLKPAEPIEVIAQIPEGPPVQFKWRRTIYKIIKSEGPERIGSEWWGDDAPEDLEPVPRDYYRVEDQSGRRYWLYRRGLYGPRGKDDQPAWFMHGFFA